MKVTGIGLMILAVGIADFAVVAPAMNPTSSETNSAVSSLTLGVSLAVGLCGLMVYLFGGRGFSVNRKPRIQPVESREVTNSIHVSGVH